MADYIYLLQNRLTPAQRHALEAVRDAARAQGMTVFLAGGAARDLTSGTPVRDLDFSVQGEVKVLVDALTAAGATIAGENALLSSVYLLFPGGVRTELAPTLAITFPKPGEPEVQSATILDDLRRRDFTANAMAISLNEGSYGLLLDPLNGVADIENRELRLASNYGFIEQPALLLRAARLTERLGWTLEERTHGRYETAKEEYYIQALPARDRGYELEEIFYEEDPLATLEHLTSEGWSEALYPAWTAAKADREALERVRVLMGQLDQMGIHIDPSPVFFPLLTAKLNPSELSDLKALFVRPGFVEQIDSLDARSKELGAQLTSKAAAAPSETWKMLFAAEPEVVLWLAYSSRSSAVQAKFRAFLNEWPQMRQRVPYALMQEMRITPDLPGYEKLLEDLFFALIDGKLDSPEATRAFLEPFSPPAPAPQASPRRRPAKATRSRSKKAAAPAAAEPELEADDLSATGDSEDAEETSPPAAPEPSAAPPVAPVKAPAKKAASLPKPAVEAKQAERRPAPAPSMTAPHVPTKAAAKSAPPVKSAAKVAAKAAPAPAKETPKPSKAANTAPSKAVPAAKKVAAVSPAKAAKGSVEAAPAGAKAKVAAKKLPAKAAQKIASKQVPQKGSAGKSTPLKAAAAKKAVAKVAAKNSVPPARPAPAAKKAVPVKKPAKAVKAAAKGRR